MLELCCEVEGEQIGKGRSLRTGTNEGLVKGLFEIENSYSWISAINGTLDSLAPQGTSCLNP